MSQSLAYDKAEYCPTLPERKQTPPAASLEILILHTYILGDTHKSQFESSDITSEPGKCFYSAVTCRLER